MHVCYACSVLHAHARKIMHQEETDKKRVGGERNTKLKLGQRACRVATESGSASAARRNSSRRRLASPPELASTVARSRRALPCCGAAATTLSSSCFACTHQVLRLGTCERVIAVAAHLRAPCCVLLSGICQSCGCHHRWLSRGTQHQQLGSSDEAQQPETPTFKTYSPDRSSGGGSQRGPTARATAGRGRPAAVMRRCCAGTGAALMSGACIHWETPSATEWRLTSHRCGRAAETSSLPSVTADGGSECGSGKAYV